MIAKELINEMVDAAKAKITANKHYKIAEKKYEAWMPEFVVQFAKSTGAFKVQIAAALGVTRETFYCWQREDSKYYHKEFAKAVRLANTYIASNYVEIAREQLHQPSENFNAVLYQMLGRYEIDFTENRKICLNKLSDAKTFDEQVKCILDYLGNGYINASEAKDLTDSIKNLAKVQELTTMQEIIAQLQTQIAELKADAQSTKAA